MDLDKIFSVLIIGIVVGIIILVHELGHFFMGIACGIYPNELSIGFGPSIISFTWSNVRIKIAIVPLGGYVSWDKNEEMLNNAYCWKKIAIALAGPITNMIFGSILVAILLHSTSYGSIQYKDVTRQIGFVTPRSEAYFAQISPLDRIIKVDGIPFSGWENLMYCFEQKKGEPVLLQIKHSDDSEEYISLTSLDGLEPSSFLTLKGNNNETLFLEAINMGQLACSKRSLISGFVVEDKEMNKRYCGHFVPILVMRNCERKIIWTPVVDRDIINLPLDDDTDGYLRTIPYKLHGLEVVSNDKISLAKGSKIIDEYYPSNADRLQKGDCILAVGQNSIEDPAEFYKLIQKEQMYLLLRKMPADIDIQHFNKRRLTVQQQNIIKKLLGDSSVNVSDEEMENRTILVKDASRELYGETLIYDIEAISKAKDFEVGKYFSLLSFMNKSVFGSLFAVYKLLRREVTVRKSLSGPIGMGQVLYRAQRKSIPLLVATLADINFQLASFNMLPIPLLDGGRVLLALAEAKFDPDAVRKWYLYIGTGVGLIFIVFAIYISFFDLMRIFYQ